MDVWVPHQFFLSTATKAASRHHCKLLAVAQLFALTQCLHPSEVPSFGNLCKSSALVIRQTIASSIGAIKIPLSWSESRNCIHRYNSIDSSADWKKEQLQLEKPFLL